ncbi:MAG: hypothetical protein AAF492_22870, partial [Verrucomicrobiota bacterium]
MMAKGEMNEAQLTFFGPKKPAEELYDLENDPHEINNLVDNPKFADALQEHRKLLADWIRETGDKGQVDESNDGLLQVYYRWRERCVNPEYKRVAHLAEPKKSRSNKGEGKGKKKKK